MMEKFHSLNTRYALRPEPKYTLFITIKINISIIHSYTILSYSKTDL